MGHNLTLPRSPLLGRGDTLAQVQQLLLQEDVGLLTLTGPGGIGKTRLALQVAANLLDHFVDGVYFVALAALADPDLVLPAITRVLGVRETPAQPLAVSLQEHLCDLDLLLVLDNFEQLLPAPHDIAALLAACPRLKLLVTSRAPLHLYGEHEYPAPPLALPPIADLGTLAPSALDIDAAVGMRRYAAVDLFCRRAAAVQPGFTLTPANALAVAQICTGLDGLPLAIELAAARLKLFGPATLAARLQERLALLTNGPQDLPPRQRTLRDEIAWSYHLLRSEEQLLFRRLGVFAGGFTLEAAQAVGQTAYAQDLIVLDGLAALLDQSLLRQLDQDGSAPRFGMLETIRESAWEQLERSGEAELVRCRHACYFLGLAETLGAELDKPGDQSWAVTRLLAELDNFRAVMAWTAQTPSPDSDILRHAGTDMALSPVPTSAADLALRLAGALAWFGLVSQRVQEVYTWLAGALRPAGEPSLVRAKAHWGAGTLAFFLGDYPTARAQLETSAAIYRRAGDQLYLARSLREACIAAYAERDLLAAQRYGEESVAILRALGRDDDLAIALDNLGATFAAQGSYDAARKFYEEEYALGLVLPSINLCALAAALTQVEHALELARASGEKWTLAMVLNLWGEIVQRQGDMPLAGQLYQESLVLVNAAGDRSCTARVLYQIGILAQACGPYEAAASLFAFSSIQRTSSSGAFYTLSTPAAEEAAIADVRMHLGEQAFAACCANGRAMPLSRAMDLALEVLAAPAPAAGTVASAGTAANGRQTPGGQSDLTVREREVLRLLAAGLSYAEIAAKLVISPRTVNSHLTTIYSKLGVTSRAAAMHYALHHDI